MHNYLFTAYIAINLYCMCSMYVCKFWSHERTLYQVSSALLDTKRIYKVRNVLYLEGTSTGMFLVAGIPLNFRSREHHIAFTPAGVV